MPSPSSPRRGTGLGEDEDDEEGRMDEEGEEEEEEDDVDTMGPCSVEDESKSHDARFVRDPSGAHLLVGYNGSSDDEEEEEEGEGYGDGDDEEDEEDEEEDEPEVMNEDALPLDPRERRHPTRRAVKVPIPAEDAKAEESDDCATDNSTDRSIHEGGGKRAYRQAAMNLFEATANQEATCEPGRLRFRKFITIQPSTDPHSAIKHRGKKFFTDWVKDVRGYEWRIMYFPYGNNIAPQNGYFALSVYLELKADNPEYGDKYCRRMVNFSFKAINFLDDSKSVVTGEAHEFTSKCADWGFPRFLHHKVIFEDIPGFIYDDKVVIEANVEDLPGVVDMQYYESKRETGMVGLRNQGATCYMNSLLQTLWGLRQLRMAVYDMPTENEDAVKSVALALQRVFYRLQTNHKAVQTKELTKAFGWETYETFQQQDVQELMRVLCDRLEEKMKGTKVDGTIKNLFEGRFRSFTRCLHVDYVSQREESFYDVQLDVKGCGDLATSFQKYIGLETLCGDNQYEAEGHGKQDAQRGMIFMKFPPVLTVHLKRFEFDPRSVTMVKINDRFEFPLRMNLDDYVAEDCRSPPSNEPGAISLNTFSLHSILVHSGDVHAGHYYAYMRPSMDPNSTDWFKFDDDLVTRISQQDALEDSFGVRGPDDKQQSEEDGGAKNDNGVRRPLVNNNGLMTRSGLKPLVSRASAYMLVYVREIDLPQVMREVTNDDIPRHLKERFQQEMQDSERKAKETKEHWVLAEVVTAEDVAAFNQYVGMRQEDEKADFAKLRADVKTPAHEDPVSALRLGVFKVRKFDPIASLLPELRRRSQVPLHLMRLWMMCTRQNKTIRVDQCITVHDETNTINMFPRSPEQLMTPQQRKDPQYKSYTFRSPVHTGLEVQGAHLRLYLEVLKPPPSPPRGGGGEGGGGGGPRHNLYAEVEGEGGDEGKEEEKDEEEEEEQDDDDDGMEMGPQPLFVGMGQKRGPGGALQGGRKRKHARTTIEEEEERAYNGTVADVLDFLEAHPHPVPGPDEIMLFFKRYSPEQDPSSPLKYTFHLHVPRSLRVRDLMTMITEADSTLKEGDEERLVVYEEITPTKVSRLQPNQTLEALELVVGDILCYQLAPPEQKDRKDVNPYHDAAYNSPHPPLDASHYFSYMVLKRRVHFRPFSSREAARLQGCLESVKARRLEVEGKCWVGVDKDTVQEIVLEVSVFWPYRRFQEALGTFLEAVLDNPLKLRFYGCDLHEERPARPYHRNILTTAEINGKDFGPGQTLLSPQNNPFKDEVLFFEILPFPMPDIEANCVRDVVINDARLRTACAAALASNNFVTVGKNNKSVANGAPTWTPHAGATNGSEHGVAGGAPPAGPTGTTKPSLSSAPIDWTAWTAKGEPLAASAMLLTEASVGNLLASVVHLLGPTADLVGSARLLLVNSQSRIERVLRRNHAILTQPESYLKVMTHSENRARLVYDTIDTRELVLVEEARRIKRIETDLVRRAGRLNQEHSGFPQPPQEEQRPPGKTEEPEEDEMEVDGNEERKVDDGPERRESPSVEDDDDERRPAYKFVPIQVNFAHMASEATSQVNGGNAPLMGSTINYIGYPLISFVERTDTLDTVLSRLAPRIGEEVETLRQWVPRLVLSTGMLDWPAEEAGGSIAMQEDVAEEKVQANGPSAGGGGDSTLWTLIEQHCRRLVNVTAFDVSSWNEVPSLVFLRSEPPQIQPFAKDGRKKSRRYDQGIKIREG